VNPLVLAGAALAAWYWLSMRRNPEDVDDLAEEVVESIDAHELQALYADVEDAQAALDAAVERLGEHVDEMAQHATENLAEEGE
jgi:NAD(P)-dependent dehydrogenase (short-subunit alcohol dehydrogenase family)